jgi:hypothetical protein
MALHDRLMQNLLAKLPGASLPLLQSELFNTIDDACRNGWIWRETISVTLVDGEDTYVLAPAGTEVLYVQSVTHETFDLTGAVVEFGVLTLKTAPTQAYPDDPVYAVAMLTPAHNVSTSDIENWLPSDMWSEHYQMFMDGVEGRMMAQPAKPYTNPQLAAFHTRSYNGALARARHKVRTGGAPGAQVWRFPAWA